MAVVVRMVVEVEMLRRVVPLRERRELREDEPRQLLPVRLLLLLLLRLLALLLRLPPPPLGPLPPPSSPPRRQQRGPVGVKCQEVDGLVRASAQQVDAVAAPEGRGAAEEAGEGKFAAAAAARCRRRRRRRRACRSDSGPPDPARRLCYARSGCAVKHLLYLHALERGQRGARDGAGGRPGGKVA